MADLWPFLLAFHLLFIGFGMIPVGVLGVLRLYLYTRAPDASGDKR